MHAPARLGETDFAIVDVETTGLYFATDRVVEVAVVRLRPDGKVLDEYDTLVNPRRDVGACELHHITASDVMRAPAFGEICGDIGARLRDAVVVGHNVRFDLAFLAAEFARVGLGLPELPRLCTLRLAHRFLPIPARKLADCCGELGIRHDEAHSALGDARATAELLKAFIHAGASEGLSDLAAFGCEPLGFPAWDAGRPSGKRCTRADACRLETEARGYLARLVARLPGDEATSADEAEYLAVLDRVLEDRRITPAEGELLMEVARRIGLSRADVMRSHHAYVDGLAAAAWVDGQVTDGELRDLLHVGELLGVSRDDVMRYLERRPVATPAAVQGESLRGKRVCFTGSLAEYTVKGEPLTREVAQTLAADAGLVVCPSVTKKVELLVVADPNTLSGKAAKARTYGTRILAASAFFRAIGVALG